MFVPLKRMPLNPNGKIDKPALPFPDTAQVAPAGAPSGPAASPTEEAIRAIWARVLPSPPSPIPLDESFFDVGGHSILATRLIFEIRKAFLIDAPLGLIFDKPTIAELAAAVDELRSVELGFEQADGDQKKEPSALKAVLKRSVQPKKAVSYSEDYESLLARLRPAYLGVPIDYSARPLTVFLTGATGFLGAFILRELLSRPERVKKVVALVRAPDAGKALERLRDAASGRGVWDEEWVTQSRLEVVKGDLDQERFGLDEQEWNRIASETDAIVHNGALVHWVYPYERLRPANVLGTLTALDLAATSRPKLFVFVSSTSAIDTEYYVQLSDSLLRGGENSLGGVPESDDLEGARTSLKTGYGQSKWVSEKLLFEAGRRGLKGHIVRPGYVVGDSESAGKHAFASHTRRNPNILVSHKYRRLHLADGEGLHPARPRTRHQQHRQHGPSRSRSAVHDLGRPRSSPCTSRRAQRTSRRCLPSSDVQRLPVCSRALRLRYRALRIPALAAAAREARHGGTGQRAVPAAALRVGRSPDEHEGTGAE